MRRPATSTWLALLPWLLVGVALVVRLYYLRLTHGQAVWWDEAEYLIKAKSIALGTPDTGFFAGRPLLFSLAMAGVYAVGLGELTIRALLVAASVATVYLTYRVGERLVGQAAGLVGAWLFGMSYVSLFYSMRIMTDIPHVALCLLGVHLFLKRRPLAVTLSLPVLVLAVLTRFPAALMLVVIAIYCAVSERTAALRRREYWTGAALGVLVAVPFVVHSYVRHGDPLYVWKASQYLMSGMELTERLRGLWESVAWIQRSFGWVLTALLIGGLVLLLARPVRFWGTGRNNHANPSAEVFVILWLTVPLFYFGFLVRSGGDVDRYLLLALPPVFLAIGYCTAWLAAQAARVHATAGMAVVLAVIGLGTLRFLPFADTIIRAKLTSYDGLRDAGLWIKEHSAAHDVVLSRTVAQLTYYSERRNETLPEERQEFDVVMATRNPRYVVVSRYQPHPQWILETPAEALRLRAVAGFPKGRVQAVVLMSISGR